MKLLTNKDFKTKDGKNACMMSFGFEPAAMSLRLDNAGVAYKPFKNDVERKAVQESFGWLTSGADLTTFFPDLNLPEGVMPKPEDFIEVPFRALSATTVAAYTWRATEFPENVLKKSVKMLTRKPIHKDHESDLDWVGLVMSPKWSPARRQDNMDIPGGIDVLLAIDAKTNPKLARGLLAGGIYSDSVTVVFEWEPSHEFESEWEFADMVGRMAEDGNMIRRIATRIMDYHELSLTNLGADPFAKLIDVDGNLVHIDKTRAWVKEFSAEAEDVKKIYKNDRKMSVSCALNRNVLHLSGQGIPMPAKSTIMEEKLLTAFCNVFGLDAKTLSVEAIEQLGALKAASEKLPSVEAALATSTASLTATQADVAKLATEITDLKTLATTNAPVLEFGKAQLLLKKSEIIRLYKLNAGNAADASVVSLFENAGIEALDGLLKLHVKDAVEKFQGHCKSCGSHDFTFQSSFSAATGQEIDQVEDEEDFNAMRQRYTGHRKMFGN